MSVARTHAVTDGAPAGSVLRVENLCVSYGSGVNAEKAVRGVSFSVRRDEVFGLVGESGSGKSTLSMAILRLLPSQAHCDVNRMELGGTDLTTADPTALRQLRWVRLAYIPQGSMGVLNPVIRVREHFLDTIADHARGTKRREIESRIETALAGVNLQPSVLDQFPHELSGGMKQRVCIALAILLEPELIIADEPTSALDVVSQRQVLETLSAARRRVGASMIMIGHDMALQAQVADRIGIMFAGRIVEIGPARAIFETPLHPYTQRLIGSIPSIRHRQDIGKLARGGLQDADGTMTAGNPDLPLREVSAGHFAAIEI